MPWKALKTYSQVLHPKDAEEPILSDPVRSAIYEWLTEINMKDELKAAGLTPRRTALLYGPPGCGKTTLAHHLAARLGVPLVTIGAEHIVSAFLGASGQNVGRIFDALAQVNGQCVVLFDEIDAIASARTNSSAGADRERNATLTVLLRRIEMFDGICMAATNVPDIIDPAMWRRFGIQIDVALPGEDERFAILSRYLDPFFFDGETMELLTGLTAGASPSLLRQLMEGVKRSVIMGAKLKRDVSKPVPVFRQIVASITPPPECQTPQLWGVKTAVERLENITWPPKRGETND